MIGGFLASFLGSSLLLGANTGLVGAGLLPVVWVAVYSTITTVEDMLSAPVSTLVSKFSPGSVLVTVELADSVLSVAAVILLLLPGVPVVPVLIGYLVVASILPLLLDLAEEFYAEQVAKADPTSAMALNAALASLAAGVGLLVARPLGSYFSSTSVIWILAANAVLSLAAVFLRRRATRLFPTSAEPYEHEADTPNTVSGRFRMRLVQAASLGVVSPLTSGVLALITAVYGTYLALFVSRATPDHALNLALCHLGVGVGAVLGPQFARRLRDKSTSTVKTLAWVAAVESGTLLVIIGAVVLQGSGTTLLIIGVAGLAVLGICATAMLTLVRTERQIRLRAKTFVFAVGWSHSFSAAGALLGTWLGLALGVAEWPTTGLSLSATLAVVFAGACAISATTRRRQGWVARAPAFVRRRASDRTREHGFRPTTR